VDTTTVLGPKGLDSFQAEVVVGVIIVLLMQFVLAWLLFSFFLVIIIDVFFNEKNLRSGTMKTVLFDLQKLVIPDMLRWFRSYWWQVRQ
jgi:hypothetical protein